MSLSQNEIQQYLVKGLNPDTGEMEPARLAKAVGIEVSDASPNIVQDLEPRAYIATWSGQEKGELPLLRMLPTVPARKIKHEYNILKDWGRKAGPAPFFRDLSTPRTSKPSTGELYVHTRLLGNRIPVGLLPALVAPTIDIAGSSNMPDLALRGLWMSLNWDTENAMMYSDTGNSLAGDNEDTGLVYKGILQQIRENSDGTRLTSPLGRAHVTDMRNQPLTLTDFRNLLADIGDIFGQINCCLMPGRVRENLATSFDDAARWFYQGGGALGAVNLRPGQSIDGIRSGYGQLDFVISKHLQPEYAWGKYDENVENVPDRPQTRPAIVVAPAVTTDSSSQFVAADEASYAWVVTEVTDQGHETFGVRLPASGFQAVAEGEIVTFTVRPRQANVDRYMVYRMKQGDTGVTSTNLVYAQRIAEVAAEAGGADTEITDANDKIPGTCDVIAFRCGTPAEQALINPQDIAQVFSRASAGEFAGQRPDPMRDNLARVTLGPETGTLDLAQTVLGIRNPLIFRAGCIELTNSFAWHFKNVQFR